MKINKIINNKKASEGSTLTWMSAMFIILLIMAVYFLFLGLTILNKDKTKTISQQPSLSLQESRELVSFLQSKASNGETISNLILSMTDKYDSAKYKTLSEATLTYFKSKPCLNLKLTGDKASYEPIISDSYNAEISKGKLRSRRITGDIDAKGVSLKLISESKNLMEVKYYGESCI